MKTLEGVGSCFRFLIYSQEVLFIVIFFPLVSGKWIFHVGVLDVQLKFKLAEEVSFQVR
jgi:hypothetical protein